MTKKSAMEQVNELRKEKGLEPVVAGQDWPRDLPGDVPVGSTSEPVGGITEEPILVPGLPQEVIDEMAAPVPLGVEGGFAALVEEVSKNNFNEPQVLVKPAKNKKGK